MIFMVKGELPWSHVANKPGITQERIFNDIKVMRRRITLPEICDSEQTSKNFLSD
jgi:hypothetical protein